MTRELKLALIIGFSLVLVVAILIADHLSSARRVKLAEGTQRDPSVAVRESQAEPLPAAFTGIQPGPLALPEAPSRIEEVTANSSGTDAIASHLHVSEPVPELRQGTAATHSNDAGSGDASLLQQFRLAGHRVIGSTIEPPPTVARLDRTEVPSSGLTTVITHVPNGVAIVPAVETTGSGSKQTLTHKIVPGDSMYKLAQKYYGDGKAWRRIAQANPTLGEDAVLKPGMNISIPADAPKAIATANKPTESTRAKPSNSKTYTVQKGDTLGEIAQKTLGTVKRAKDILAMNSSTIKDPDRLSVNAVLYLPAN